MFVYKTADLFDHNTGKKIGTHKVFDHAICDFTGKRIDEYENPSEYLIDFNDNDPCFGDGEGERWLYDYENEINGDDSVGYHHYELFGQSRYKFKSDDEMGRGYEVFGEMVKLAQENIDIYSLEHLLRWSRGRMLEKEIKSGRYKIEDFISE